MNIFDAVRTGDTEVVNSYLKFKGDPNASLHTGATLLMIAATYGQTRVIGILIGAGADVNAVTYDGMTALMYSVLKTGNPAAVNALLDSHADVNAAFTRSNSAGATALHLAANMGSTEVVKLLVAAGADLNARDNDGETPLMRAKQFGHTSIMEILKTAGANE